MSSLHFNLNRPMHLARRDAFFERAVELLYTPVQEMDSASRLDHVESIQTLLNTAQRHAFFATMAPGAPQEERDFLHFLDLISQNLQSAQSMTQNQSHLEGEENFLVQFLGDQPDDSAIPALHYRRRADDILQGLWHLLRLAHKPYRALQQNNLASLTDADRARYKKAYQCFRDELTGRSAAAVAK